METRHGEVAPTRERRPADSAARGFMGSCVRVVGDARSTTLTVRLPGGSVVDLALPVVPDLAAARRLTAGLRRVSWVSIDAFGEACRCEVAGVTRRPRRMRLPVAAGLALAAADVPTVVRLDGRD